MREVDQTLAGKLLVAAPQLADPNFARTVIMLLQHHEEGALGVVLNRPTSATVAEALPDWEALAGTLPVLFQGGPVSVDGALCLASLQGLDQPPGWQGLELPELAGIGIVDLDSTPVMVATRVDRLRIFAGYAGWGPGQLETEIQSGGWYVLSPEARDPFTSRPTDLWRDVLRRQGGQLATLSTMPDEISLN
ncbi:MAG: YqgE/AlgH family protein [Candidatus Dormiibacterota bacterium]